MDVLCATFGNPDYYKRIFHSLRFHKYDKLVVVYDEDEDSCEEFKRLANFAYGMEKIRSPKNNFWEAYRTIDTKVWERYKKENLFFDISGGTKLLSMAALLCAFNHGVQTWHYEEGIPTKLPVYKGLSIFDKYTEGQMEILALVKDGMLWDKLNEQLKEKAKERRGVLRDFGELRKTPTELVIVEKVNKEFRVKLTEMGGVVKRNYR